MDAILRNSAIDIYGLRIDSVSSLKYWESLSKLMLISILVGMYATSKSREVFGTKLVSYIWCALIFFSGLMNFLILMFRLFGSDKKRRMVSDRLLVEITELNAKISGKVPVHTPAPKFEYKTNLETERPLVTETEEAARIGKDSESEEDDNCGLDPEKESSD